MQRESASQGGGDGSGDGGDGVWDATVSHVASGGGSGNDDQPPAQTMVEVIFRYLAAHTSFEISILRALFPDANDRQFGLAWHEARERARKDLHIEYISQAARRPGFFFRADAQQRLNRASQFIRTANKKLLRSMEVVLEIPPHELSGEQHQRAQRTVDRTAEQVGRREAARRRREEADGFEYPETSRPQRPARSPHARQQPAWPETRRPGRGNTDGDANG